MLLRVAAVAGASALVGMAACSSSSSGVQGVANHPDGSSDADEAETSFMGAVDAGISCNPCGSVVMPDDGGPDAGDSAVSGLLDGSPVGLAPNDAGTDDASDGGHVVGLAPNDAGTDT